MAEKPNETNNKKEKSKKISLKQTFSAEKIGSFLKRYGTSVYMLVAFCLVAAVMFSVLALNMNYSEIDQTLEIPDIKIPTLPDDAIVLPSDKDVGSIQSGVSGDISDKTEPSATDVIEPVVKYAMPVSGKVIKKYSIDALVFSATLGDYRIHSGVDIETSAGADVLAYSDGTVSAIEETPMMGTTVTVSHGFGLTSVYMNLSKDVPDNIKVGTSVKGGDKLGTVGKTAMAEIGDPPHLHFEIRLNGDSIDPEEELKNVK